MFRLHRRAPFLLHLKQPAARDTLCCSGVGIASAASLSVCGGSTGVGRGSVRAAATPRALAFLVITSSSCPASGRSTTPTRRIRTRTLLPALLALLDADRLFCDRLNDLEGQKAEDIDDVVVGLGVRDDAEAGPLAEAFALAEGEGGLAAVGPEDVLVARHVARAFVGGREAGERGFVLLFFRVVGFVFEVIGGEVGGVGVGVGARGDAVGGGFGEEGVDFPGQDQFGFLGGGSVGLFGRRIIGGFGDSGALESNRQYNR